MVLRGAGYSTRHEFLNFDLIPKTLRRGELNNSPADSDKSIEIKNGICGLIFRSIGKKFGNVDLCDITIECTDNSGECNAAFATQYLCLGYGRQ